MARQKTPGPTSSTSSADLAVKLVNSLTHTGDFAGQPFKLRPWQEKIVRDIFQADPANRGRRKYRKAFLALPRKQGKTELAAAILLVLLLGSGRRGQHLYSASGDRAQASLIFRAAASMVRNNPSLARVCQVYDGYKRIIYEPADSFYEALSSDAPRKHGLGPSVVLFDEVHVLPNRELHDVLTTGFGARLDPLTIYITTAGWDRTSICWELWDYARKVRDGVIDDQRFLPILYEARQDADWTDEAVWREVMPALGDFCSLEFIREECKKAKEIPAYENTFRQLYLNQWTEQAQRWLSVERWQECGGLDVLALADRECYAGLDLGVTGDMSALALVFPNDDGGYSVTARFWVPEDGRWQSEQRNHELYREWHRRGLLTFTPGEATDFDQVEHDILALHDQHPFIALFADRAYASHLLSRLFNNHGLNVKGITQGPVTLNEPMVKLESMILDRKIKHDDNPILAWNVSNANARRAPTGLMYLDKSKTTNRIDGLAALIDAIAAATANDAEQTVHESPLLLI